MVQKPSLSIIILTGEITDKTVFDKCLLSVEFADEVIKVDTKNIKGSFSEWRNEGLKKAKGDWIFYVDVDEIVDRDLRNEIENTLSTVDRSLFTAFAVPRRNFIFGKEFKHSGQYPDYQKRLFLKSKLKGWEGDLHEEPVFESELGTLKNPLIHYKNINISQMIEKTNKWSEIEADLMLKANHPKMNFFRFASAGVREFWKRMIIEMAFLDGKEGIIYAFYQVYSRLISYSKLWEKQQ